MGLLSSLRWLLVALCVMLVSACMPSIQQRIELADAIALQGDLAPLWFRGDLTLKGYYRPSSKTATETTSKPGSGNDALWVFIEGDGLAWVTASQPSRNPTPLDPQALRLAAMEADNAVLYLGRPAQYQPSDISSRFWLGARFSADVVQVYIEAIEQQLARSGHTSVLLVGYSGGGALAALVAQRMIEQQAVEQQTTTLAGLITIAGNLDIDHWVQALNISPLTDSLNPADKASLLKGVPQRHLVAEQDRQVPPSVLASYLSSLGDDRCVEIIRIDGSHAGPWHHHWQMYAPTPLPCSGR